MYTQLYWLYRQIPYLDDLSLGGKVTHLRRILRVRATQELVDETSEGYSYTYNGVEIEMQRYLDFIEFSDTNTTRGYTLHYSPKPGDTIVDVGAFPGAFTIYAAKKVGNSGQVIAVEPHPDNFSKLKKNINMNGLENVTLVNRAAWNRSEEVDMYSSSLTANLYNRFQDTDEAVSVPAQRLDDILADANVDRVDYINTDIKGAEIEALQGLEDTLNTHAPALVIVLGLERSPPKATKDDIIEYLDPYYDVVIEDYPPHRAVYAWNQ